MSAKDAGLCKGTIPQYSQFAVIAVVDLFVPLCLMMAILACHVCNSEEGEGGSVGGMESQKTGLPSSIVLS